MSAISPSPISTRIAKPLKQVAQRQWTVLAAKGLIQTLVMSLAVLLLISVPLGHFENMAAWGRVALAVVAWGAILCTTIICLRPALQRWNLSKAAQAAENTIPDSEERISSAVELSQAEGKFRGSPELVAHLMKQAEEDASRVNATTVIPFGAVFAWAAVFLPVIGLWMTLTYVFPGMVERGLWYSIMPLRPTPDLLTTISLNPNEDQTVIEGDSLTIQTTVRVYDKKEAKKADLLITFDGTGTTITKPLAGGNGNFKHTLDNLQQSFKYKVSTDRGDSRNSLHVTVVPRPKIAGIVAKYQYPKYASKYRSPGPAEDTNPNIHALAGSTVTLAVHAPVDTRLDPKAALDLTASQIVINEGRPDQSAIPLTPSATGEKNTFEAKIELKEGVRQDYHIRLTARTTVAGKEYKSTNKDADAHAITADPDQPPTITILSKNDLARVRPDDDRVPVLYLATDDYGVDKVEALVSVDDRPARTIPVTLHGRDRTNLKEQWILSVPAILKLDGVATAKSISYQLKATDAREPIAQTALSERQTLVIDKQETQSFQEKLNEVAKLKLEEAIRKAIDKLTREGAHVAQARDLSARDKRSNYLLELAKLAGDRVAVTGSDLSIVAGEFVNQTMFAEIAKKAKAIADNEIKTAADSTKTFAKAPNREGGDKAYTQIVDARDKLQKLLKDLEDLAKKAEAQEAIKEAQKKQEEVAKAMAEHPENVAENLKKQQEAINKLNEAYQKDPSLQPDKKAQEDAQKLAELQNQVQQDQQKQTELQNQTAKQEEQQQAQKAANAVAEAQKELNKEVQQFAQAEKKPLEQAKAQTPEQKQQEQLVKNIEDNKLQQAAQQAQAAADQLIQDAQKLDQQAQVPAKAQKAPEANAQDKANEQAAAQAQKQAEKAAQELKKDAAQQPKADPAQAAQAIKKAAEQIEKQADKIAQQNQDGAKNPQVQKAAEAAKADAQQAEKDAQAAADAKNAQDAQQDANKAAQEVAQAAKELNQAAQAEHKNQQQAAQAAKEADKAAQAEQHAAAQQQKNADAAQQAAQDVAKAAQQIQQQAEKIEQQNAQGPKDPQVQKNAEAAKADAQEAAKDAQAAAHAPNAQEAQQDAGKAAQELAKAGQELNQAAQGEAQADAAQAQQQNQQAAADNQKAAAQAAQEAKGLAEKQQAIASTLQQQAQQQADAQQNAATPQQAAQQQQALAQQTQQAQKAAENLAQQAQADQNANLAQRADQAAKALDQAAKDQQQAAQAADANKPADAAQAQANAQQDLAKAAQALAGADPAQAQAQADPAQGQADQGKPEAAQGQGEQGKPEQGQGTPQQTQAQALAQAQQAQQQALQPNAAAAEQAAQALAQAAQAGNEQGHEPGNEPGHEAGNEPGHEPGTNPHEATDPKQGISGSDTGGDNKVPPTVAALGFDPSEWAKLPPITKRELMNASQQSVPPAYKDQVKNYYIRRAQLENARNGK